jgi:hypothetical protein
MHSVQKPYTGQFAVALVLMVWASLLLKVFQSALLPR